MKIYLFFFVLIIQTILLSQSKYEVTPGVKGNEIILSLTNSSSSLSAINLNAQILKSPSSLEFAVNKQTLKQLKPNEEIGVKFVFDVKRNAPPNKTDTLTIQITSTNGVNESKNFYITYLAPKEYQLSQNFPNPFNPTTMIQYQLPVDSRVSLKIYDIVGRELTELVNEDQSAGFKEVNFNAQGFASGFCRDGLCRIGLPALGTGCHHRHRG